MSDLEKRLSVALKVAVKRDRRPPKPARHACPKCKRCIAFVWARGQWIRAGHKYGFSGPACPGALRPHGEVVE